MTQILSTSELAEIRERAEKTAPGPWEGLISTDGSSYLVGSKDSGPAWHVALVLPYPAHDAFDPLGAANLDFIVGARTDIPRLLATVDAYREVVEALANESEAPNGSGERSMAYLARVIARAKVLLAAEETTP